MNLKRLSLLLLLGICISTGYGAVVPFEGGPLLADPDGNTAALYKPTNVFPGSNAIDGGAGTAAAVPEPSTVALLGLGLLGFSVLTLRRRGNAGK